MTDCIANEMVRDATASDDAVAHDVTPPRLCVAYVIHSMGVGGAERSIARLINELDHRQFQPLVICLTKSGPAADWIESPDVPVIEIRKGTSSFDRAAIARLTAVLTDHRVDVVHSHNWGSLFETSLACRRANTPVHLHAERGSVLGEAEMRGLKMRLRGLVAGWTLRRCDAVITNAHSVARRIEDRCGYPADRVQVIPNGVEIPKNRLSREQASARRRERGISDDVILLGSVGRLAPVKGFDLAVKALTRLQAEGGNYHLLLVGDGPERDRLQLLATQRNLAERVHLVGHQDDVGPWLSMIDVYLNTSHSEGMSQSLIEAMAAGLPVIATDVGDSAVVLGADAVSGCVIPPGDADAICYAVTRAADHKIRAQMAQQARARHRSAFEPMRMGERYQSLYRSLLTPSSDRTRPSKRRDDQ